MGTLEFRAKDYPEAEKYLSKAVLYAPDYVEAHQFYALTLAHLGRKTDAARESTLAASLREQQNKLSHGYFLLTQPSDSTH